MCALVVVAAICFVAYTHRDWIKAKVAEWKTKEEEK